MFLWPLYMCMMFVTTLGNNLIVLNPTSLNLIVTLVFFPSTLGEEGPSDYFPSCCICTGPHFRVAMNEAMGLYAMCTFVGISPYFDNLAYMIFSISILIVWVTLSKELPVQTFWQLLALES